MNFGHWEKAKTSKMDLERGDMREGKSGRVKEKIRGTEGEERR